jgi:hypothetical protein
MIEPINKMLTSWSAALRTSPAPLRRSAPMRPPWQRRIGSDIAVGSRRVGDRLPAKIDRKPCFIEAKLLSACGRSIN